MSQKSEKLIDSFYNEIKENLVKVKATADAEQLKMIGEIEQGVGAYMKELQGTYRVARAISASRCARSAARRSTVVTACNMARSRRRRSSSADTRCVASYAR